MPVTVTKGELSTIMGILNYAQARLALKAEGCVLAPINLPGMAVIEVLDSTNGIDLDNPEVVGLCDLLAGNSIISADARQRIADYVATATPVEPTPPRANYRVPVALAVGNPYEWIGQFCDRDRAVWEDGGYLMIATDGACHAPGAEVLS